MNTSRGTFRLSLSRLLPLVVVLALLAACGGGSEDSAGLASLSDGASAAATTTTAAATEADAEEAALAFSQCMRDEGVTDFPDPELNSGGGIGLGGPGGDDGGIDFQSEEVQAAFEACGDLLEGAAFTRGGGGEFDATEIQDNLLAMADCLRDQGLEVDDPDLSNFGPVAGGPPPDDADSEETGGDGEAEGGPQTRVFSIFGDLDMEDPAVQAAMETCQDEVGFAPGQGGAPGTVITEDDGQ